jgi:transposase
MLYAGIDVAKSKLDLFCGTHHQVCNSKAGCEALGRLVPRDCTVVLESTGGYERLCEQTLREAGFGVCVVNPAEVHAYRRSLGRRSKTDCIDAQVIALFAEARKLKPDTDHGHRELKTAVGRMQQLRTLVIAEKNRLEHAEGFERDSILRILECLKLEQMRLRTHVRELIRSCRELQARVEVLTELKGIGEVVASTLVAVLPELGTIGNKQIASLAGLAPHAHDSGMFKGKRRIGGGRAIVRSMLYLAAMSAVRVPGILRDMYQRLRAVGKPAKVALVACARKLLVVANARVRDQIILKGGRSEAPEYA